MVIRISLVVVLALMIVGGCHAQCKGESYLDALPAPQPTDVLFPLPSSYKSASTTVYINGSFTFLSVGARSDLLDRMLRRYKDIIFAPADEAHIKAPRMIVHNAHPNKHNSEGAPSLDGLDVSIATDNQTLQLGTDESYTLTVATPRAILSAQTPFGALRGLETFSQLVQYSSDTMMIQNTPWVIQDAPRYPHRGLLIDTSRHYLAISSIFRTIDALSYTKMNALHWHMVDAQSFPVESERYPLLTNAKYSSQEVYTKADIKKIVDYAFDRGVRVIPEIDTPGHTASWGVGYPNITVCRDKKREDGYCAENPCGELDPSKNETYEVVEGFLNEMMDIFPDNTFHFGADEVVFACWNTTDILAWMSTNKITDFAGVLGYYESRIFDLAKSRNRSPVHWQEVFQDVPNLPSNAIIQVWLDFATLDKVVTAGYRAILSNYQAWYLDCGFANWCPYCSWMDIYDNDPLNGDKGLTPAQEALILGGEICLWSELVDDWNLDSRIWPRAAAAGERLWSPKKVTDHGDALARLMRHSCRLSIRGIHPDPLMPGSTRDGCVYIPE